MGLLIECLLGDAAGGKVKEIVPFKLNFSRGSKEFTDGEGGMAWLIGTGGFASGWSDGAVWISNA